jgi:hypothetical protein
MKEKLNQIQNQLVELFKEADKKKNAEVIFNLSQFLSQYKIDNKIDHLDSEIYSENIIESLQLENPDFFRSVDYQYNFLTFLIKNYNPTLELREYIDKFIDKFKEEFTVADIKITDTGVTRCKTNIRFAVKSLRDNNRKAIEISINRNNFTYMYLNKFY